MPKDVGTTLELVRDSLFFVDVGEVDWTKSFTVTELELELII